MDIEQLIRQELADERHTQLGWLEPVPRVQAGIRRRRRRRYAAACGVVAVMVLVGLGAANVVQDRQPAGLQAAQGSIAWLQVPAELPKLTRRSPRPDARGCTGTDLAGKPWVESTSRAENGTTTYTVLIANGSDSRCTLGGTPGLSAPETGATQSTTLPAAAQAPQQAGAQTPATIDPGEPARTSISVSSCTGSTPSTPRPVAVTIGEQRFTVPGITAECSFTVSPWYVQAPLINAPLTVSVSAPSAVHRGSTLAYHVTITNTANQPYKLSPCPVYQQGIGAITGTYKLNCSITAIPKHGSLTYEMQLDVPDSATPGPTKLTWMVVLTGGTVGIANLSAGGATVQILE